MAKRPLYLGFAPDAAGAVYSGDDGFYTSIFSATVTNPTGSSATLDVWVVNDGDSRGDSNKVYHFLAVGAGETKGLQALINLTMEKNAAIHAQASAASALSVQISGDKHS